MSSFLSFILLVGIFIGICVVIYLLLKKITGSSDHEKDRYLTEQLSKMEEQNRQLSQQNEELRKTVDERLEKSDEKSREQFKNASEMMSRMSDQAQKAMASVHAQSQKIISEVTVKLTKLDETNKQVVNFSGQLKNLQDILKNPKQRGVVGEFYLEETLKNVLPPDSYQMQYEFKDKEIVDAVVFVKEKIIPIDSKFSLENYERLLTCEDEVERARLEKLFKTDLKTRIDETAKYVRPSENTMDFAFMFIPSEAIYYDLLVNKVGAVRVNTRSLIEYAFNDRRVIIVSPTSFLAYLQTVLQGLRALQIEEKAKGIKQNVEKLSKHLVVYDSFLQKLGGSLGTTINHYNMAYKEFKKVDKDVMRVTEGNDSGIEPLSLEKPQLE